jgi:predicted DNA-binding transcriptional regulator AlpA
MQQKQLTVNKKQLKELLGVGDLRLKRLKQNPTFPKPIKEIKRWSIIEIEEWLTGRVEVKKQDVDEYL